MKRLSSMSILGAGAVPLLSAYDTNRGATDRGLHAPTDATMGAATGLGHVHDLPRDIGEHSGAANGGFEEIGDMTLGAAAIGDDLGEDATLDADGTTTT